VQASPQQIDAVRHTTLGFVTQFLRVIPRSATLDLVAEPLIARNVDPVIARENDVEMRARLRIPMRLWSVPPAIFSGGEQQRVNIARTLICDYPVLLLDEPTASLDAANRDTVMSMIDAARARGVAVVGIFHDEVVGRALATHTYPIRSNQFLAA
jgi:alpha-D-ribose 1-methylphosphonate 5-triphosphate synthase subunit PhnL